MDKKVCKKCKKELPYNSKYFPRDKQFSTGLEARCRKCVNEKAREYFKTYRKKLRNEVLQKYSKNGIISCECCDEDYNEFLALDHINGGGRKDRLHNRNANMYSRLRARGYPDGFRILCHNCNMSLGIYGYCPHNMKK